jgi:nicotinate-nucleotide adenylyltransferase
MNMQVEAKEHAVRRIGIFCGTFDPVHIGHLQAAQACLQALQLERVLFVPSGKPLIRQADASAEHRCEMIRLTIAGHPELVLSGIDLQPQPRHAVDIVGELRRRYPDAELIYIIGANKLRDIPGWKDAGQLMTMCSFAVYPRVGYDAPALCGTLRFHGARVTLVPAAQVTMSSGQIRAQLRLLSDAPGKLLPRVAEFIASNGLYQPDYERMVRQAVSPSRLLHSQGARQTAVRLARLHGLPMQKAGVAGILHDCAKDMELGRLQAIARQARLPCDAQAMGSNALLHGPVGAQIARMRYHVSDTHILNAIRYHTTGRAGMNALELAIFVADAIEPTRKYPGLELVRGQAQEDLRLAALTSLAGTQEFVKTKGLSESPLSLMAIADLRARLRYTVEEDKAY